MNNPRILSALVLILLAAAPAAAQEFELRGTVLCNEEGDAQRSRPIREQFLVAVPSIDPSQAQIIPPDGLYRFTLAPRHLDRLIHIRILQGRRVVAVIPEYLEPTKLRQSASGKNYYVAATHLLPWDCDSLSVSLATAEAVLQDLKTGSSQSLADATERRMPALGAGAAAVSGAVAIVVGSGAAALPPGITVPSVFSGELLFYGRHAFSPALGRTHLSWRDVDLPALWNPSRTVFGAAPVISLDVGSQPMGQVSATLPLRAVPSPDFKSPVDVVTLGAWYRGGSWVANVDDSAIAVDAQEVMVVAALAKMLAPRLSISTTGRYYRQSQETDPAEDLVDMDISMTWMVADWIQAAAGGTDILGSTVKWGTGTRIVREGWVALLATTGRMEVGGELYYSGNGWDAAGGLSYRLTNWLAADVAGATRYETGSGGVNIRARGWTFGARAGYDNAEGWTGQLGLGFRSW